MILNNLLMIVIGNLESAQHQALKPPIIPVLSRALSNAMRGAQRAAALDGTAACLFASAGAGSRSQPTSQQIPQWVDRFFFNALSVSEYWRGDEVGAAGLWWVEVDQNQLESALINLSASMRVTRCPQWRKN